MNSHDFWKKTVRDKMKSTKKIVPITQWKKVYTMKARGFVVR